MLSSREGKPGDAALFAAPEAYRSRPLERLLPAAEGPK